MKGDEFEVLIGGLILFVLGILIFIVISFIIAIPVMFLWNWLMTRIFELTNINYIEAWGIVMLAGLLIKSTSHQTKNK